MGYDGVSIHVLTWRATDTLSISPGLAALGPFIPLGTSVIIPDLPPQPTTPPVKLVSLFG